MSASPIRIVVADDHAVVREGIRRVLDGEPGFSVVAEASTSSEVMEAVEAWEPDVLLLDLGMPETGGLEVLRRLKEAGRSGPRVLVLSMYDEPEYVLRAVEAGVDGYLLKDEAEPALLRTAVRTVHAGDSYFGASAGAALADAVRSPRATDSREGPLGDLTGRELQVLALVASGRTNRQMASELGISPRTVETHRENLMRKLGIHTVAGLTRLALEEGLLDERNGCEPGGGNP